MTKFYDCDPFIPGMFPRAERGPNFFASPIHPFDTTLSADLYNATGAIMAPAGTRAIELGFVDSPHQYERRETAIRGFLADIGSELCDADLVLNGITQTDPASLAALQEELGPELPPAVIAHTGRVIGEIAVRDFGFVMAANTDAIPLDKAAAIQLADHDPATIYMSMHNFLAMSPPQPQDL